MQHDFSEVFETENVYWQRVLEIFEKNEHLPKKVVSNRNLHHKFPKSFSKKLGQEVDNDKDNLISLTLHEHLLLHYYYYLLAKKGFKQSAATAFTFMVRKMVKYITPETAEMMSKDYEEAKTIADQHQSIIISDKWREGVYKDIHEKIDHKAAVKKAMDTFNSKTEEFKDNVYYERGKTLRGKTYEEAFGYDKAQKIKEQRRKVFQDRLNAGFRPPKTTEHTLIQCVETGEKKHYSEWMTILGVKSKSSIANVLNNPNKTCKKLHFITTETKN